MNPAVQLTIHSRDGKVHVRGSVPTPSSLMSLTKVRGNARVQPIEVVLEDLLQRLLLTSSALIDCIHCVLPELLVLSYRDWDHLLGMRRNCTLPAHDVNILHITLFSPNGEVIRCY